MDDDLRAELLRMVDEDQRLRRSLDAAPTDPQERKIEEGDRRHARRMRAIIDEHGWPGKSLVGDDGARAAWTLVQHAYHDVPFMRRCLDLMTSAVENGEASPADHACLFDRVMIHERGQQYFGTHYLIDADYDIVATPLIERESVDERRRAVGLVPLEEHLSRLRAWRDAAKAARAEGRPPPLEMPSPRVPATGRPRENCPVAWCGSRTPSLPYQ
jgi:hypothetical protein